MDHQLAKPDLSGLPFGREFERSFHASTGTLVVSMFDPAMQRRRLFSSRRDATSYTEHHIDGDRTISGKIMLASENPVLFVQAKGVGFCGIVRICLESATQSIVATFPVAVGLGSKWLVELLCVSPDDSCLYFIEATMFPRDDGGGVAKHCVVCFNFATKACTNVRALQGLLG
jgi:hypothetical protein